MTELRETSLLEEGLKSYPKALGALNGVRSFSEFHHSECRCPRTREYFQFNAP